MALKVSTGFTRKVGQPDYGSIGASCNVEFELDQSLLDGDLAAFHEKLRDVYVACCQAVNDELARHNGRTPQINDVEPSSANRAAIYPVVPRNEDGDANHGGNGRGVREATDKQRAFIRGLVAKISGFGNGKLDQLSNRLYGKRVDSLTSFEASGLIDTLKAIRDGKLDATAVMEGSEDA